MKKPLGAVLIAVGLAAAGNTPAASQAVTRVYTQLDSDKCPHTKGQGVEDYGSWLCPGHDGIAVRLSAGHQRMQVSFGRNAGREPAARETFPRFNSAYKGTIEWRIDTPAGGKSRAFATILRWNVKLEDDERDTTGRVLVVTRLGPGGVCHVGYVDARANPNANELAQQLADEKVRGFRCGADKPIVAGKVTPGLSMPKGG
jgi:hypothetical protein